MSAISVKVTRYLDRLTSTQSPQTRQILLIYSRQPGFQTEIYMLDVCARIESIPRSEPIESRLALTRPMVSARELITEYVAANESTAALLLVQPTSKESILNTVPKGQSPKEKDAHRALAAFANNRFILLVDDRQVEGLDDEITLTDSSVVTFLRLTPLVGG